MRIFLLLSLIILTANYSNAQDIQAIIDAQEIDTMLYSGSKDNRINWVIQNRGSSFADKESFTQAYRDDLLKTFDPNDQAAQVPYAQYHNFFNLYTSWWPDALDDNNGWSWSILKQVRDAYFLPWANDSTGWITWFSSTAGGGGGGAGLERDRRVGDGKMYGMGYETFLHEFGHTMPGLLDEYSSDASWSGGQCWETGNTTGQLSRNDIPWRNWIEEDTPIPTPYTAKYLDKIGAFEGAMTNYFECHRPTARSCFMGAGGFGEDYGLTLCSVCIQRVICYMYQYVNVIEEPIPAEQVIDIENEETITFSVKVVKPEPNTQKTAWILNGKTVGQNSESITLTFGACESYELKYTVIDENPLIRYDPKFEDIYPRPYQEHVWMINSSGASGNSLASNEQVTNSDCTIANTGGVQFNITGGLGPYTIHWEGVEVDNPIADLAAGQYKFDIVDANGCAISKLIEINSEALLAPTICSSLAGSEWKLKVEDENYMNDELSFLWSNGDNSEEIAISESGIYKVTVTNSLGCSVVDEIEVFFNDETLGIEETVTATELSVGTGSIYLDISGGRSPYHVTWEDKSNKELTDTNKDNIISSGTTWDHLPAYAFDNDLFTKWLHAISEEAYIGYVFDEPMLLESYKVMSADDVPERDPKNWELQASNDGVDWVVLDAQSDHMFDTRYQEKSFLISSPSAYTHYRFFVLENYGDIATQIQELELVGSTVDGGFEKNEIVQGPSRTSLKSGTYRYTIKDQNGTTLTNSLYVPYGEPYTYPDLNVVTNEICDVFVENPNPAYRYYWFDDKNLTNLIHVGDSFRPIISGNYYVAALDNANNKLSNNIKGFAIDVEVKPEIESNGTGGFFINNPRPELDYLWYADLSCAAPLQMGVDFFPTNEGTYYVAAYKSKTTVDPIDPLTVDGLLIRMDASDINGDGLIDESIPNGEGYDWLFTPDNGMTDKGWFAYRSNYQNGLGVADFGTIWLQQIDSPIGGYQTIILAYEENPITFPERAPFDALSYDIPKHGDGSQFFSDNAPDRTKNGMTYLNGELIDPFNTANDFEFNILATAMSEPSLNEVRFTDTHWEGKIGELLLYDRALSEDEIKGISSYLNKKWIGIGDLESERTPFTWNGLVATEDLSDVIKPSIYPNPSYNYLSIDNVNKGSYINIYNQSGNLVNSLISGSINAKIDVSFLLPGMYLIQIYDKSSKQMFVERFVKM